MCFGVAKRNPLSLVKEVAITLEIGADNFGSLRLIRMDDFDRHEPPSLVCRHTDDPPPGWQRRCLGNVQQQSAGSYGTTRCGV